MKLHLSFIEGSAWRVDWVHGLVGGGRQKAGRTVDQPPPELYHTTVLGWRRSAIQVFSRDFSGKVCCSITGYR